MLKKLEVLEDKYKELINRLNECDDEEIEEFDPIEDEN